MKTCRDCGRELKGHGAPLRCKRCAALARYVARFGRPPEMLEARCGACGLRFKDYASNHKKTKSGLYFCSSECRVAWAGVVNSVNRGGDGRPRTKAEKDRLDYLKNSESRRVRQRAYYRENRDRILAEKRVADRALKAEVVAAYGGRCECCGESHLEFMTIDHVNGDGAEHRRTCGKGRRIYEDLKRRGFPKDGYCLLCLNCNVTLGFYGYCPHRPEVRRTVNKRPMNPGRKRAVK